MKAEEMTVEELYYHFLRDDDRKLIKELPAYILYDVRDYAVTSSR